MCAINQFQEMKRQERNHLKERGRLQREKVRVAMLECNANQC